MKQQTINLLQIVDYQHSSDQIKLPFIGKYHQSLRKRNNAKQDINTLKKKQYKKKKVSYKSLISLYQGWNIEMPLSQKHVYNFHNILAINQNSMRNPQSDESFLSTKFYMKKVKKVMIKHGAILFQLEDLDQECTPIPYICERLKSFGDSKFLQIALTLQHLEQTLSEIHKKLHRQNQYSEDQLELFLRQMSSKLFFSQYSPNLLVISQKMLELLGFDVEEFAIESIKYKSILYEFFSAEHYSGVIYKHLENINLLRDYLEGTMSLQEFCKKSLMVYNDFLYNRSNKKIKCEFFAGTSKQLTPFFEIRQIGQDEEEVRNVTGEQAMRKKTIQQFREAHRRSQIELIKKIAIIPKQLDPNYRNKICSYKFLESLLEENE